MSLNLLGLDSLHHINQLEWEILLKKIGEYIHFESCMEELFLPPKAKTLAEIEAMHQALESFMVHGQYEKEYSLHDCLKRLDPANAKARIPLHLKMGRILSLAELHQLASYCECAEDIRPQIQAFQGEGLFSAAPWNSPLPATLRHFLKKLRVFVDSQGQVDYSKHPILRALFEELQLVESSIRSSLKGMVNSSKYAPHLQFGEYDLINDHYVLAIRSDSYQGSLGQIISRSESGLTLFVEPFEIKDKCNKRLTLLAKIDEVINKICLDFCEELRPYHGLFSELRRLFEKIDLCWAKGKYSWENHLVRPQLSPVPEMELHQMFHPLIPSAVKNNFYLLSDKCGVILSGPNTGGKTAALKTIGLCHLFLHFGLFLPASSAKVHPFSGIFYFGNDQQNLPQGLSSFSAEVKNYLELFQHLASTNLIIIDEIFNSTSSEEASALALGLFEELHRDFQAKIIVSTHHQMLKTFMHSHKDYISSHVGFDLKTCLPTYKIIEGMPGSSMALTIFDLLAHQYRFPNQVTVRAAQILDSKALYYETLLQEVSQKSSRLDQLIHENQDLHRQLLVEKKSQEGILKLKLDKLFADCGKRVEALKEAAESVLAQVKKGDLTRTKAVGARFSQIKADLGKAWEETLEKENIPTQVSPYTELPKEIKEGNRYFSTILGKAVEVKSLKGKKKEVTVQSGGKTLHLPLSDLKEIPSQATPGGKAPPSFQFQIERAIEDRDFHLDCRGMRLEEFQKKVEDGLGDLLAGGIPYLMVVHGHGTGVLKHWLREFLKTRPDLRWEAPKESADGATKILIE